MPAPIYHPYLCFEMKAHVIRGPCLIYDAKRVSRVPVHVAKRRGDAPIGEHVQERVDRLRSGSKEIVEGVSRRNIRCGVALLRVNEVWEQHRVPNPEHRDVLREFEWERVCAQNQAHGFEYYLRAR